MNFNDRAISFCCHDAWLYGILSMPEHAVSRGVLILVGGPQYRVGSHRQFTLLARHLAAHGVPVMRFDYRGMGDSEGSARTFEEITDDLSHAIDLFFKETSSLKELVIWGLCDAASAALFYAHKDSRVTGLVLLNPWVRTETGIAKAYLKHYYLARIFAPDFWQKIRQGKFDYAAAVRSVFQLVGKAVATRKEIANLPIDAARLNMEPHPLTCSARIRLQADTVLQADGMPSETPASPRALPPGERVRKGHDEIETSSCRINNADHERTCNLAPLPDRMLDGLSRFKGKILLILSGNDLTSQEFSDLLKGSRKWQRILESVQIQRRDLPDANHTFSKKDWRDQVAAWTKEWLASW
jgi:exosortase A-associated hydrolase 1